MYHLIELFPQVKKEIQLSKFQKLSHVLWYCQYHIVFVPKYRYRILKGSFGKYVYKSLYAHTERSGCEVVELASSDKSVGDIRNGQVTNCMI